MSKKKKNSKPHRRNTSIYLNPEMEAINNMAITVPDSVKNRPTPKGGHVYANDNGWWNKGGGGSTYTYTPCSHDGSKVVYDHDGKQLFGSTAQNLNEFSGNWDLIIDLARAVRFPSPPPQFVMVKSSDRLKDLQQYVDHIVYDDPASEVLQLDWPDMQVPPVSVKFWQELWDRLPAKTVICCLGSHGRTGTCMAALMIASGLSYYDAIETVRKKHCNKCIETLGQEKYLHRIYIDSLKERIELGEDLAAELEYAEKNPPTQPGRKDSGYTPPVNNTNKSPSVVKGETKINSTPLRRYRINVDGSFDVEECCDKYCWEVECIKVDHFDWLPFDPETEMMGA